MKAGEEDPAPLRQLLWSPRGCLGSHVRGLPLSRGRVLFYHHHHSLSTHAITLTLTQRAPLPCYPLRTDCKDKASLLRELKQLYPETRALVQATCEGAGVWDGGAEMPTAWEGESLPSIHLQEVAPAAEPDGPSRIRTVRMSPAEGGRGVCVDRNVIDVESAAAAPVPASAPTSAAVAADATALGGAQTHPDEGLRICSAEDCCAMLPGVVALKCGACSRVFYCGRRCQLVDWWARHKLLCPRLQAETAMLRLAAATQAQPEAAATTISADCAAE